MTKTLISSRKKRLGRLLGLAGLVGLGTALGGGRACAAPTTFTVTNNSDAVTDGVCTPQGSGDGCTLREAVAGANALGRFDANNQNQSHTITFAPSVTGTITLLRGELRVESDIGITGPGARVLAISGGGTSRIFSLAFIDFMTLSALTLRDGAAIGQAGQDQPNPNVNTLTSGQFAEGGAVQVAGQLSLFDCAFLGNTARGGNGGNASGREGGSGGPGIGGALGGGGSVFASRCLFAGNSARGGNAGTGTSTGIAGAAVGGAVSLGSSKSFDNCTFVGNTAAAGTGVIATGNGIFMASGGAIDSGGGNAPTLRHCTIAGNSASVPGTPSNSAGGGIYGSFNSSGSLFANNLAGTGPDFSGTLTGTRNLVRDPSGATVPANNLTGLDPLLGALANNGGPTDTISLQPGSPAIDSSLRNNLSSDQRGFPRPVRSTSFVTVTGQTDGSDIGALETALPDPSNKFLVTTAEDRVAEDALISLREAIQAANANSDSNTISFAIPGAAVTKTINVFYPGLPTITAPVTIDGSTQSGYLANNSAVGFNGVTPIVLSGSSAIDGIRGLTIASSNCTILGLKVQNFVGTISPGLPSDSGLVEGTLAAGIAFVSPASAGISGGTVSGCTLTGNATGVLVSDANGVSVGSFSSSSRNYFTLNQTAVSIVSANRVATSNRVINNLIGGTTTGDEGNGNGIGVSLVGARYTQVGGPYEPTGNRIVSSTGDAVRVQNSGGGQTTFVAVSNSIHVNSIFGSGGLGINLIAGDESDGVTPNDVQDTDTGPNGLQNFPVVTSAQGSVISGMLNSAPNKTYYIGLFASPARAGGAAAVREGAAPLVDPFISVTTNNSGNATFRFTASKDLTGQFITATATDGSTDDTSEFSAPVLAQAPPPADTSGALISEFRFRGATGPGDEFVEIYNTRTTPLNISGWSLKTNTGTGPNPSFQTTLVPQNTFIPARGHFLFTGGAYSLSSYGTGNAGISSNVADDSGAALLNALGNTVDAVGFTTSEATLREGSGLTSAPNVNGEYTFMRDFNVSLPRDSADSTQDFVFVSASGAPVAGTGGNILSQLGAPSPQGLSSPNYLNNMITTLLLDPNFDQSAAPNRVRQGAVNSGTILVRRTLVNKSGRVINRVRLSVTRITSLGSPVFAGNTAANQADVRLSSSSDEPGVAVTGGAFDVFGTTLEAGGAGQPAQPLGGGLGSSVIVTLNTPLALNQSRSYSFLLQVVKSGNFNVAFNIEALLAP